MRANKNTRAVVVGVFIFLGLAIFIVTVLTLGGEKKTFAKSIRVKAIFDDINGLQKGNNVWFSGVKIGTVKDISFYGISQVEVKMDIDQEAAKYIHQNAAARISQEGMIGNRIVVIEGGTTEAPGVTEGTNLHVAKSVNPEEIMNTFQTNNKNLLDITSDFKVVSKGIVEGKGTVGRLLTDETLIREFMVTLAMLKQSAANAQRLSADVAAFTSQLARKGTLLNEVVTDTIVFRRLKSAVSDVEDVAQKAGGVVDDLKKTTGQLNTNLNNPNAPVGMLLKDEKTAAQIKDILRNLQTSSQKLDEDLEAAQHNFLLRGYFKKKAKKEAEAKKQAGQ